MVAAIVAVVVMAAECETAAAAAAAEAAIAGAPAAQAAAAALALAAVVTGVSCSGGGCSRGAGGSGKFQISKIHVDIGNLRGWQRQDGAGSLSAQRSKRHGDQRHTTDCDRGGCTICVSGIVLALAAAEAGREKGIVSIRFCK